jgi:hypothetical protein
MWARPVSWPAGGSVAPTVQATAWLGPRSWDISDRVGSLTWSTSSNGRVVSTRARLEVSDPDGSLRRPDGPLWTCGQRLWLRLGFAGCGTVPLPPLLITAAGETTPRGGWRRQRWLEAHPTARVEAVDLTQLIDDAVLPLAGPTGVGLAAETARLLALARVDLPVAPNWPAGGDAPTPATGVWPDNPLSALADLWGLAGCAVWVDRLGMAAPRAIDPVGGPLATLEAGQVASIALGGGARPRNVVEARGTTEDGTAVAGRAETLTGPYATSGPYGRVGRVVTDSAAKTPLALTDVAEAALRKETAAASRTVTATVHPAVAALVDPLDPVAVEDPRRRRWVGQTVGLEHFFGGPSKVTVRVPWDAAPW